MRSLGRTAACAGLAALALSGVLSVPAQSRPPKPAAAPAAPPAPPKPTEADWRTVDPTDLLVIDTNKGRIVVALAPQVAPASVARIQTLARQHFYDALTFFRVIDGFMDQTGDPKNTGEGGSLLPDLKGEFTFRRDRATPFAPEMSAEGSVSGFIGPMAVTTQPDALMGMTVDGRVQAYARFCTGVLGMARAESPDSGNSQFFLMRATYPKLDQRYTAAGRVVVGQDVVRQIKTGEPVEAPQDRMLQVRLASDLPVAQRPVVRVLDPASAAFKAEVDRAREDAGDGFSVCDIDVPVQAH